MLPWVSNGYIAFDPKFAEFTECDASKDIEPKPASHSSSVTQQNLINFRSLYDIPRDHELIRPLPQVRANTPLFEEASLFMRST